MTKKDIHDTGFNRGYSVGDNIDLVDIGDYTNCDGDRVIVSTDNWMEVHLSHAYDAEDSGRDFSPFEFTAHALNELEASESKPYDAWEVFDDGINKGIAAALKKRWKAVSYTKDDYRKAFEGTRELFEACWRMLVAYAKGSEVEWNDGDDVKERLEQFAGLLINDSSSRFYVRG